MANVTPNLIKIGQSNIKNPKMIVDTHDTNMEKLKVYLTNLVIPEPTPPPEPIDPTTLTYLEYGTGDYDGSNILELTLVNAYTEITRVNVQLAIDGGTGDELNTSNFQLIPFLVKELFYVNTVITECYSKVRVAPKGLTIPLTIAGGKIIMTAVCKGMVIKP